MRSEPNLSGLPAGFLWGAATAAFPIEGDVEHRGRSIWDRLCRRPGWIADGADATIACDHVNRYRDDVQLMRELGLDAYRFSIAWPRVQPTGKGPLTAGLGFYDRLVDSLLEAGIQPWITQYHWDLPEELEDAGGWVERDVVDRFTDYAVSVHAALGDRVRHWATLNEPWCSAWLGYGSGEHAPGIADHRCAARAAHHLLLAHGRAIAALRAQAPADHQLGIVLGLFPVRQGPEGTTDAESARVRQAVARIDGLQNRWWLDALLEGRYPEDVLDLLARHLDGVVRVGDLEEIAQPLDYLGVNYYHDAFIVAAPPDESDARGPYPGLVGVGPAEPNGEATSMGWPVTPTGLQDILVRIGKDHPAAPPLVVTENGSAWDDEPAADAEDDDAPLPDPRRVAYLRDHVGAVAAAVRDGADVRGYFAWSLMDNFEWACGYSQRFGLVQVDFDTLRRRPRTSFGAYRDLVAAARGQGRVAVSSRTLA